MIKPDVNEVAAVTLGHYNAHALAFEEGTREHDVSQNIAALLESIEGPAPFTILDFGCGPGRDLQKFTALGHRAIGLEGAAAFVTMARTASGCEVWQQNFLHLDLPPERFDGVYANASLFHVPREELPRVLKQIHATLKPRGVLISSNPRGQNQQGMHQGRFGAYHDLDHWRHYLNAAGFIELSHYYRPQGMPCAQQSWLASVWRKD